MSQFDPKLVAQAKKTKGYLLKKSDGVFSSWKKRYFIVLQDVFSSYEDETLQIQKKSLPFSQITSIRVLGAFQFQVQTKKRTYLYKARSQSQQDLWVASLNILKENYFFNRNNPSKNKLSDSSPNFTQKTKESPSKHNAPQKTNQKQVSRNFNSVQNNSEKFQKITYLLRQKQLSKFFAMLGLQRIRNSLKEPQILKRIIFIEEKEVGLYFSLSSKSIYPLIDGQLVKEDFIVPYQPNILYFLPHSFFAQNSSVASNLKKASLKKVCNNHQIVDIEFDRKNNNLKLMIACQKPINIKMNSISQNHISALVGCFRKAVEIGKQFERSGFKFEKNIDLFLDKYKKSEDNELLFYKMVENQFNLCLLSSKKMKFASTNTKNLLTKEVFFQQFDFLVANLRKFIRACEIKDAPIHLFKEKFLKLYHNFLYKFLNKSWGFLHKQLSEEDLISYAHKVYEYYTLILDYHSDSRIKQGFKTLIKIVLKNFETTFKKLTLTFNQVDEESLRILKKVELKNGDNQKISKQVFYCTYIMNFLSILNFQVNQISQFPKNEEISCVVWNTMNKNCKIVFEKLLKMTEQCKERNTLIGVCNNLKLLKNNKLQQMINQHSNKGFLSLNREKQAFVQSFYYQISQIEIFCVKKLFIISFSSIDRDLLKCQIKDIDFSKICCLVIEQIHKLNYVLPEVQTLMYEAAFEQVCYFFYICVGKFQNKNLPKQQATNMITDKLSLIRNAFADKIQNQKLMSLLRDLNLLKQFLTCPLNSLKNMTREIKKVFGASFSEENLKNLISLRTNVLREKQLIFQECREEIKSSYNSTEEIQSFQRESFFNSSYRRERKSTLTESIQQYCDYFDKIDKNRAKNQLKMLPQFPPSIKQGYLYRKRMIKNINTTYSRYFYRLIKGKLFQYDDIQSEEHINCYLLNQLKKCYFEEENQECICLEFNKENFKFKAPSAEQAGNWVQKILEAMEEVKSLLGGEILQNDNPQSALFEDFSKQVTPETKQSNQISSSNQQKNDQRRHKHYISPEHRGKSPHNKYSKNQNKRNITPNKYRSNMNSNQRMHPTKTKQKTGCGSGCNFF